MPSLLLDTHVVLWAAADPERLSPAVRQLLHDRSTQLSVSTVSLAEVDIKVAIGRLELDQPFERLVASLDAQWLALGAEHVIALRSVPLLHRDPFDRLLLGQARAEQLTLVTADDQLLRYDVDVLSAR
jgi:PIN domain nuclease of toxin-antitoxin system